MRNFVYVVPFILLASFSHADQGIRILDRDIKNKGIECDIRLEKKDGKLELVSYSNKEGYVQKKITCDELDKVIFVPKGDYFQKTLPCPLREKEIFLSSIIYPQNLMKNAELNFETGNYGASALAYTDAAARLRSHNVFAAMNATTRAYEAAGKVFGVNNPYVYDVSQQKNVISPELGVALRNFQRAKGIELTGKLDYKTLSIGSEVKLHQMLFYTTKEPNL